MGGREGEGVCGRRSFLETSENIKKRIIMYDLYYK